MLLYVLHMLNLSVYVLLFVLKFPLNLLKTLDKHHLGQHNRFGTHHSFLKAYNKHP